MKAKTQKAISFLEGLHNYLIKHPQFRKRTKNKSEVQIQTEIRPLIIAYLEKYFREQGVVDYISKAHQSFYWEGEEGRYGVERKKMFGSRNYPDFIIQYPYNIAVEYKQSPNGSLVKQGLGQSILHTLSNEFDFSYYLFHDQSKDKRIEKSLKGAIEKDIIKSVWKNFNVFVKFV